MDALLTKDASEILKTLDILENRECGYTGLVKVVIHHMNTLQQEVDNEKAARKLLKCLLDNDLLILFIRVIYIIIILCCMFMTIATYSSKSCLWDHEHCTSQTTNPAYFVFSASVSCDRSVHANEFNEPK